MKFTKQSNADAHLLAASHGLAPALRAFEKLECGLFMVAMNLIDSGSYHQRGADKDEDDGPKNI